MNTTTTSSRQRLAIIAAVALALVCAALAVAMSAITPIVIAAVLGTGALLTTRVAKQGVLSTGLKYAGLVGGLVAMAVSSIIDRSILAGVLVALFVGLDVLVIVSLSKQLAPAEDLSAEMRAGLARAGVTLAEESAGGWHMGATSAGVVVLVRPIEASEGEVTDWKSVRDLESSAKAPVSVLATQGISPLIVAVTTKENIAPTQVGDVTVCSLSKVGSVIRKAPSSVTDPRAVMSASGVAVGRSVARAATRQTGGAKKSSKVVHQGRVTKRVD